MKIQLHGYDLENLFAPEIIRIMDTVKEELVKKAFQGDMPQEIHIYKKTQEMKAALEKHPETHLLFHDI